ncbi:zinc finger protein 148 [Platysternon megacephalum]|uniref:Zinc finger protein 148 n=1 Tax=Platysternon megacephalum TaxID=55544 RepID=A0A4D9EK57_9SAUR|nr:zinc finger protein 148 [Platysternon megacephalum]
MPCEGLQGEHAAPSLPPPQGSAYNALPRGAAAQGPLPAWGGLGSRRGGCCGGGRGLSQGPRAPPPSAPAASGSSPGGVGVSHMAGARPGPLPLTAASRPLPQLIAPGSDS